MKRHLLIATSFLLAILSGSFAWGQTIGQWDFSKSNLVQTATSTLGDLQFADGAGGTTESLTVFASTADFGLPSINGTNAVVMSFQAFTNGQGYLMPVPTVPNEGGSLVNEWTLIMDLLYPSKSDKTIRPIIDPDFSISPDPVFIIGPTDGLGASNGPFNGTIASGTWYRIGISVTTNEVDTYINGQQVGANPGAGVDGTYAFALGTPVLILASGDLLAAPGYVKNIQLRTNALNAGQMQIIGGPSATDIPVALPPVPSFIQARLPAVNDVNVLPHQPINVVLNQGDQTINASSIQLLLDGVALTATVTNNAPTFGVGAEVTDLLNPNSIHKITLIWQDNTATHTNSWSFTEYAYESVTLPTPFYFENFDELAEGTLPPGWITTNATVVQGTNYDLCDPISAAYENWVVINTNRLCSGGPCAGFECDTLDEGPIALNGQLIGNLGVSNILYFESDNRCGGCFGQIGSVFTPDLDCTGRTNVFVSWNSLYLQNQNNIAGLEYSIDQGTNWLPVRYYLPITSGTDASVSDVIKTNGVIDIQATFLQKPPINAGVGGGTNWSAFILAPITTNLIPYVVGLPDDEASFVITSGGIEHDKWIGHSIEIVRLNAADGQSHVRFRFFYAGTCSWFWGVDNFGLYEINTPVITTQPQSQAIDAGTSVTLTVVATSTKALTYQWQFNGSNINGATNSSYTISSVSTNNGGQYMVIVSNSDGSTQSSPATLTVNTTPVISTALISQVADVGTAVTLSPTVTGGEPRTYSWLVNGSPVSSLNSIPLVLSSPKVTDSGAYQLVVANAYGAVTSSVAQITIVSGPITNNLVAHLAFDGNFNDSSGRGNNASYATNGTVPDPTPTFAAGKIGQAFEYTTFTNGSKIDYATFGYPADLMFDDTTPVTISFWVNYTNQNDDLPFISNKDWNSSGNEGWGIFCQGGGNFRINFTGPNGGSDKFDLTPTTVIRDGTWHNVLVSVVRAPQSLAGDVYTYVDGAQINVKVMATQGSIDTAGLPFANEQNETTGQSTWAVNIGQDGTGVYHDQGSAYNIGARIDDLGIWRRALSAGEAAAIFSAGQAGKDLSQAVVSTTPSQPTLTITVSGTNVKLSWQGSTTGRLQTTPTLRPASWTDVPGTTGASTATVPATGAAAFFRVAQ